jgi:hypothetical protein
MQDRLTKAMPPFSPGLTNQPCFNMASTAVMLTLCLCNRAALRLAKRDPDSVSRSPSNRHARLTPPSPFPPPPHNDSTLSIGDFTSEFMQPVRAAVGGGNTRNPCRRTASTAFVNPSWDHLSPFCPWLLPFAPAFQRSTPSGPKSVLGLLQSCCMAQTLLCKQEIPHERPALRDLSRRSNSLHDAGVVPSSAEPLRPCWQLQCSCKPCIMVQID